MWYCLPFKFIARDTLPIRVSSTARINFGRAIFVAAKSIATPRPEPAAFTIPGLTQLLASSRKDLLSEWKLAQYNGGPLQWEEWFGRLISAIDSVPLSHDGILTYLKSLLTGKTKTDGRVCTVLEKHVQGRFEDTRKEVRAGTGSSDCLIGPYQ